jgi:hypothetical protein
MPRATDGEREMYPPHLLSNSPIDCSRLVLLSVSYVRKRSYLYTVGLALTKQKGNTHG